MSADGWALFLLAICCCNWDISNGRLLQWRRTIEMDGLTVDEMSDGRRAIFARLQSGTVTDCRITEDKEEIAALQSKFGQETHWNENAERFGQLFSQRISECHLLRTRSARQKRFLIAPGTDWCGMGHRSPSLRSSLSPADECCRQHDSCPIYIKRGQFKYNTRNYLPYTVSYCKCDNNFYDCLKTANSTTADMVGRVFFNVLDHDCFDLERGETCKSWNWWGSCSQHGMGMKAVFKELPAF